MIEALVLMSPLYREVLRTVCGPVQGKMLGMICRSKKGGAPEMAGKQKLRMRKHKIRRDMIPPIAVRPEKGLYPCAIAEFFGCY
jgi:hypothetical protein